MKLHRFIFTLVGILGVLGTVGCGTIKTGRRLNGEG